MSEQVGVVTWISARCPARGSRYVGMLELVEMGGRSALLVEVIGLNGDIITVQV